VAAELGCDWHTVNDAVLAYGEALVEHPGRFADVHALGLDETAFVRAAPYCRTNFRPRSSTCSAVSSWTWCPAGAVAPREWLMAMSPQWRDGVAFATLDLSGAYKAVLDACLPSPTQVADPFHVIKLANERIDDARRRIQNEILGHRGRRDDPFYRARRLLTMAEERLGEKGAEKMRTAARRRPLRAGGCRLGSQGGRSRALRPPKTRPSPSSGSTRSSRT
jgi:hypothetical protein